MSKKKRDQRTVYPSVLILEGLWSDTADAIRAAGGIPTEVSPWDYREVEDELLSGAYQAMVLTGGSDISPWLYGQEAHKEVYGIDYTRDSVELRALELAKKLGIPVLGICRGSQIMCAFSGGCLTQHIELHRGSKHQVYATPDATTFRRACASRDMYVTSLHHQCVDKPGKGMRIAALAHDGTPEAIESKDGRMLGVQFHPELDAFINGNAFAIFQWLVGKGAEMLGGRAMRTTFQVARAEKAEAERQRHLKWRQPSTTQVVQQATLALNPGPGVCLATRDDYLEANREASGTSRTVSSLPPRNARRAGDPAVPSMRPRVKAEDGPTIEDMAAIIRESTGENPYLDATAEEIEDYSCELDICPHCAMLFENRKDRDDHIVFLHGDMYNNTLEPPFGHSAWDNVGDDSEAYVEWLEVHADRRH